MSKKVNCKICKGKFDDCEILTGTMYINKVKTKVNVCPKCHNLLNQPD